MLRVECIYISILFAFLTASCQQRAVTDDIAGREGLSMADSMHVLEDYYAYGFDVATKGNPQYGLELIDSVSKKDTSVRAMAYYYKYRIFSLLEDPDSAQLYHTKYYVALTEEDALSSLTMQKEYYETKELLLKQEKRINHRNATIVFLILAVIIAALVWKNRKRKVELERKASDLLSLAENLETKKKELETQRGILSNNKASEERLKEKFKNLFLSQFKVIEKLYVAFNTPDTVRQDAVFGEAAQLLKIINTDSERQRQFEEYLDCELDGIMRKFRSDYPILKESDYKLFSYIITGFSARTIASLTGFTTGSVYTKKNALKSMIAESDSTNKDLYCRYF